MKLKLIVAFLVVAFVIGSAFTTKRTLTAFGYTTAESVSGDYTIITVINKADVSTEFCHATTSATACEVSLDLNDWDFVSQTGSSNEIETYQILTIDRVLNTNIAFSGNKLFVY
jgi:hypothetical protein